MLMFKPLGLELEELTVSSLLDKIVVVDDAIVSNTKGSFCFMNEERNKM